MNTLTLIEIVRHCRENDFNYFAVDFDGWVYGSRMKPYVDETISKRQWLVGNCVITGIIGEFKLTCDWKDSLVCIYDLRGVK